MSRRRRHLLIGGVLAVALAAVPVAGFAAEPTIEAPASGALTWSPSTADISAGGSVMFKNASTSVPHGVEWQSPPATPSCASSVPVNSSGTNWSGSCTFSQAGTYNFRCTVHASMTGTVTVSGAPGAPTVSTGAGTPTSDTEATLNGSVNPNGLLTEYFFEYGTSTNPYEHATTRKSAGEGTVALSKSEPVMGLSAGTTYHFRLVAENSASGGPVAGADHTFTTPGPPLVTTGTAAGIGAVEATLRGSVNPDGHETHYFFNYGTMNAYGKTTSLQLAGSDHSQHAVSAALTGLSPETTYHFQLVAENISSGGSVFGADRTFTTTSTPPPPPPPPPTTTTPVVTPPAPAEETPPLGSAVTVSAARHQAPVRVTVQVLAPGAGGNLQVDLLEKGGRAMHAIAGRIVRRGVPSGRVSVSVPLNARAKRALRRRHRLPLAVKIVFTPPSGASLAVTRSVILRG